MSAKYQIREKIGEGNFSSVYEVLDINGVKYAAKITSGTDPITRESIIEISALSLFKEARNIIHLVDIDTDLGADPLHPVIILPLYNANATTHSPSNAEELRHAMFDICNGMLSLYNRGLLHLDLKTDNILYTSEYGEYGRYIITDFGLSIKEHNIQNEIHTCQAQTLNYRAPEIAVALFRDRPCSYSYKADIWSIGVVMLIFCTIIANVSDPIISYLDRELNDMNLSENYILLKALHNIFGNTVIDPNFPNDFDMGSDDSHSDDTCSNNSVDVIGDVDTRALFHYMSDIEYDFIMQFLKLNPSERSNYQEIFAHPYFNGFMPSEPNTMTLLDKVHALDTNQLDSISMDNQEFITYDDRTQLVQWMDNILKQMQDISNDEIGYTINHNRRKIIFLSIILLDSYIENVANIKVYDFKLVGIACIIVASIMDDEMDNMLSPDDLVQFTGISDANSEIYDIIVQCVQMHNYNLAFSTELEYLEALLNNMDLDDETRIRVNNDVFEQLVEAASQSWFRDIRKESRVMQYINIVLG